MAHQIIKSNKFDISQLSYDNVAKNKAGGNIVYLKYDNHKKIILQTPYMFAPFGISVFTDDSTNTSKYSLDFSFKDKETDDKVASFYSTLESIDDFMIQHAVTNSKEWFGKKMSAEVVKELYRPLIKESKDPAKYASTIKYKIRSNGDKLNVEAFDDNKEVFDMDNFVAGSKARALIELTSIWFVNKQFGCTFTTLSLQVSKPEKLSGFSFQPDSDEEDSDGVEDESDYEEDS